MRHFTYSDYVDRVRRVLRFIQENLDDDLSPEACARVAHFSLYHFHRVFSGLVGESLSGHVRRIRLERAAGELKRTNQTVLSIALAAGYETQEPFTRAFRAHFGVPPTTFRRLPEPIEFPRALSGVHYGSDDVVSRFVPREKESNMIDVFIDKHPARRLLALAHRGDYLEIGNTFGRLTAAAAAAGLIEPGADFIGVYYDDPDATPLERLRSHAGLTVTKEDARAPEGFEWIDLPAGEYAVGVHRGPYDKLEESYRWLFGAWLPTSGREAAHQPCHEIYVNDPAVTAPADLITHICVRLEPSAK